MKKSLAFILVAVLVFSLCSCKAKTKDETVTTEGTTENIKTTVPVSTEVISSTEQSQTVTTTEPEQTSSQQDEPTQTAPPVTETQPTQTETIPDNTVPSQTEQVTEAVAVTGVETITDGNKTIVFPAALRNANNTYPVVSWANGTGCPTQLYIKLIEAIANAGFIVVADSSTMSGDGTAQIDSINYIINKNSDSSSVFLNKVDTVNIGVCGQSQGGRSCINAAQNDSRIRAVVSLAGASTADEAKGIKVPCLFLTATNDNIVKSESWCLPSYNAVSGRAAYASLKGGNHLSFNSMSGYTVDWFKAYLKNDSEAKKVFEDGGKLSQDTAWQDFKNKN